MGADREHGYIAGQRAAWSRLLALAVGIEIPAEQEYGGGTVTCPKCGGVWFVVYDEVYIEETSDEFACLYLQADDPEAR